MDLSHAHNLKMIQEDAIAWTSLPLMYYFTRHIDDQNQACQSTAESLSDFAGDRQTALHPPPTVPAFEMSILDGGEWEPYVRGEV